MRPYEYYTWIAGGIALCCLVKASVVQAQVSPDETLPTPTKVTTSDNLNFSITDGTRAGNNLFHSFREFSVPPGGSAVFNNLAVENIISRVTGGSISSINGLIQANNTANLFVLNPNGIIFGSNASLNIGSSLQGSKGSFLASTASSLLFTDGTQFSATAHPTAPVLTINVPMGLQFGETAGSIRTQGSNLRVGTNRSLVLVGGSLKLEGGILRAPVGRIELGSVAGPGVVSLSPGTGGWGLGYEGVHNFQNIQLSQGVLVNTSASNFDEGSGSIQVQGKRVELTGGSTIFSFTGELAGGAISIQSEQLILQDGSRITASALGAGRAGDLSVTSDSIELIGTQPIHTLDNPNSSGLFTQSLDFASGKAGDLIIKTGRLIVRDGAQVGASTFGAGQAGNLFVVDSESVEVIGRSADGRRASSLLVQSTGGKATGNAGNLEIDTRRLSVQNGARISVGAIEETINPERLGVSTGQGGELRITASDSVEVIGTGTDEKGEILPSTLLAESQGSGAAGDLMIETGRLAILNQAEVNVNSKGTGDAGDLKVQAHSIRLDHQGKLTATTESGKGGGNISLQKLDLLLLSRNSEISTDARRGSGNGGDIRIDTDLLAALENSNIIARAIEGRGGNIRIKTQGLFVSPDSTISATSERGIDGVVEINTPDVDPSQGLATLPAELVEASRLIASGCAAVGENKFIVSGRGGVPPSPTDTLSSDAVWTDLRLIAKLAENRPISEEATNPTRESAPTQIVEAQGWVINDNGEIVLTANGSFQDSNLSAATSTPNNIYSLPLNTATRCGA